MPTAATSEDHGRRRRWSVRRTPKKAAQPSYTTEEADGTADGSPSSPRSQSKVTELSGSSRACNVQQADDESYAMILEHEQPAVGVQQQREELLREMEVKEEKLRAALARCDALEAEARGKLLALEALEAELADATLLELLESEIASPLKLDPEVAEPRGHVPRQARVADAADAAIAAAEADIAAAEADIGRRLGLASITVGAPTGVAAPDVSGEEVDDPQYLAVHDAEVAPWSLQWSPESLESPDLVATVAGPPAVQDSVRGYMRAPPRVSMPGSMPHDLLAEMDAKVAAVAASKVQMTVVAPPAEVMTHATGRRDSSEDSAPIQADSSDSCSDSSPGARRPAIAPSAKDPTVTPPATSQAKVDDWMGLGAIGAAVGGFFGAPGPPHPFDPSKSTVGAEPSPQQTTAPPAPIGPPSAAPAAVNVFKTHTELL